MSLLVYNYGFVSELKAPLSRTFSSRWYCIFVANLRCNVSIRTYLTHCVSLTCELGHLRSKILGFPSQWGWYGPRAAENCLYHHHVEPMRPDGELLLVLKNVWFFTSAQRICADDLAIKILILSPLMSFYMHGALVHKGLSSKFPMSGNDLQSDQTLLACKERYSLEHSCLIPVTQ